MTQFTESEKRHVVGWDLEVEAPFSIDHFMSTRILLTYCLGWMDECLLVRYPPLVQIDIADGENEHFSIFFKVEERTLSEHRRVKRASMHSNAVSA